jgi:hypothetical protein
MLEWRQTSSADGTPGKTGMMTGKPGSTAENHRMSRCGLLCMINSVVLAAVEDCDRQLL